ncbi:hypothetical protein QCA50_001728 [Cerrena zonata]|uniref:Arrestin C-terminal-like domain-containing protein n=1 Tax=Cerrena zonata TaxID=2478898 RepID=A0AAW0GWH0_9APHY
MPASEIDDIFASKGKATAPSSSQPADAPKKKKKKAKKITEAQEQAPPSAKRKRNDHESTDEHTSTKRRVPETVLDPSVQLAAPLKGNSKSDTSKFSRPRPSIKARPVKEDEERFKDSRGTGPRQKTEEGFLIYKEDELGITEQGGAITISLVHSYSPPKLTILKSSHSRDYKSESPESEMLEDDPPTYTQDSDPSDDGSQLSLSTADEPQILIIPAADSIGFQAGFLGADFERAAVEGEIHVKAAQRIQWKKVTVALRTLEKAKGREIELNVCEHVLFPSPTPSGSSDPSPSPSTFPFSIPLPSDTPQCLHTPHSTLTHTLTATLISAEADSQPYTKDVVIHTRRYTSHTHTLGVLPETKAIDDPTRIEVQVPRTSFKAGEPIPLYLTIPTPRRELILDEGLRLRNVRAELIRMVKIKEEEPPRGNSIPGTSSRAESSSGAGESSQGTSSVQKQHSMSSSYALDMRSVVGVPGGGEVIALSGAACRLHPQKPLQIRLVLHPPHDDTSLTSHTANLYLEDGSHQEAITECASITQTTLLHTVSFVVCVHVTFMHMSSHTERVSTISIPINILPPSASLPEVDESLDVAYRKKHDQPPTHTVRHPDADVPRYEEGVAGPSFHNQGAPPPFEEREAPPPFCEPEASTSRLPTFLESEEQIFIPSEEEHSTGPLPPPTEFVFEGEGILFGFSPSDQFDGYNQETQERPITPPPTLEEATMDRNVTELANLTESEAFNAIELALDPTQHPTNDVALLPPPIDDGDPPPSIDSDFTSPPNRHHTASPPLANEAPPAFAEPTDGTHHSPPPSAAEEENPTSADAHAPPPYRGVPDNAQTVDHESVVRPPPYAD